MFKSNSTLEMKSTLQRIRKFRLDPESFSFSLPDCNPNYWETLLVLRFGIPNATTPPKTTSNLVLQICSCTSLKYNLIINEVLVFVFQEIHPGSCSHLPCISLAFKEILSEILESF